MKEERRKELHRKQRNAQKRRLGVKRDKIVFNHSRNLGIGTGRRKTAVARVYVRDGEGKIVVNGRELAAYFPQGEHAMMVRQPLMVTASENKFDVLINVYGGGANGQAGACRHGLARALCQVDQNNTVSLRNNGFLTRDPRMVERKKYGQRGARRRFQFSKR